MKKFVLNTFIFLSIVFLIILFSMISVSNMVCNRADFKVSPDVKYVIFGHSHSKCAFNDELIDDFKNFSNNGESYFYTYPKVKQVLLQNPNIETVFVEFTNSQISKDIESWIWDDKYLSYHYCLYSPFIKTEDKMFLLNNNPKGFIANLPIDFKTQLKMLLSSDYDYTEHSGFTKVLGDLDEYIQKLNQNKDLDDFVKINREISECHLKYLDKIVSFVKSQQKKIVFVRSPIHNDYSEYFENEDLFQNLLNTRYKSIEFVDYHSVSFPDSCYKDYRHLNFKGAEIFSTTINDLIVSGLLDKKDKQRVIDELMKSKDE